MAESRVEYDVREMTSEDTAEVLGILAQYKDAETLEAYRFPVQRFLDPNDTATVFVALHPETHAILGLTALYESTDVSEVIEMLYGVTLPTEAELTRGLTVSRVGYIASAYVHTEYLRQGIGQALLSHIEDEAINRGLDVLFAEVWGYDESRDGRLPLRNAGYEEVFWSDAYWPPSVPEIDDAQCSACAEECDCIGAIYRNVLL